LGVQLRPNLLGANGIKARVISALIMAQTAIWLVMACGNHADGFTNVPESAKARW
jgi:hypothetical protein